MARAIVERDPQTSTQTKPDFSNYTWEGEPGVSVYAIAGTYAEGAIDRPFGGYLFRQIATGNIFGDIVDPNGSAQILGSQKDNKLIFIKLYDTRLVERRAFMPRESTEEAPIILKEESASLDPIYYQYESKPTGIWVGSYSAEGSGARTNTECSLIKLDIPATLLTFKHDSPFDQSHYDRVVLDFEERLERRREALAEQAANPIHSWQIRP